MNQPTPRRLFEAVPVSELPDNDGEIIVLWQDGWMRETERPPYHRMLQYYTASKTFTDFSTRDGEELVKDMESIIYWLRELPTTGDLGEAMRTAIEAAKCEEYPNSAMYKFDYEKAIQACTGVAMAHMAAKDALIEQLKQEAIIHAQEARTANDSLNKCYQAATGATGEQGNWNGANPVIEALAARDEEIKRLREALSRAIPYLAFPNSDTLIRVENKIDEALNPNQ